MSIPRVIPTLLHKKGRLVLSRGFKFHQDIGNPYEVIKRLKNWDVDELIILDITKHWCNEDRPSAFKQLLKTINIISENCFIPLCVGGGLETIDNMKQLLSAGADRLVLNTTAFENPKIVKRAAEIFGSQAVNVCIDVKKTNSNLYCYTNGAKTRLEASPLALAKQMEGLGAGEITLQAIHHDGKACGY